MQVFNHIDQYCAKKKSALTIGTFDGVHIGHQKILNQLVHTARKGELQSTVLSFFPHPRMILQPEENLKLIDTIEEKQDKINALGVDNLIIHPFSKKFSTQTAETFIKEILVEKLNLSHVIIGYDHRFGKKREANVDTLIDYGGKFDFKVSVIPPQEIKDISVSSTKVRLALINGDIPTANSYLNTHYSIQGTVIKGNALGRTLGFPTANINIEHEYKLVPKNGVYLVDVIVDKTQHFGMLNIGNRPTIKNKNSQIHIEVNLFDFDGMIYGEKIKINFYQRIRNQKKFQKLDYLKKQIQKDRTKCLKIISQQLSSDVKND
ncbi:MAG: bifunctional riboflavin kinase/FAD synthetase [Flavobacteriaceae bacterium]|nr:bifunctional riboflavin kinase/FAD synthetase [Flavobacteriaceae bacterium]